MTEQGLYQFVHERGFEFHHEKNEDGNDDVVMFVPAWEIQDFLRYISSMLSCRHIIGFMREDCICVWMNEICDYFGIDINNVFEK